MFLLVFFVFLVLYTLAPLVAVLSSGTQSIAKPANALTPIHGWYCAYAHPDSDVEYGTDETGSGPCCLAASFFVLPEDYELFCVSLQHAQQQNCSHTCE